MPTTKNVEKLGKGRTACTVTFSEEEVGPAEARALEQMGSQMHLKGFRPGKAPADMVRKSADPEKLFEETVRELLRIVLPSLIEENKLIPIMAPRVEAVSRFPLTLKIIFVEYPVVKVKHSEKLKVEKKEVKADPKDVQKVLDSVLAEQRTYKPADRSSSKGDRVIMDFSASTADGADIPELKAQAYDVIVGEGGLLPGFEDNLEGLKAGDSKSFTLTLPEKYASEALRGKPVTFHVKILRVEEVNMPELTDAFAKEKLNAESAKAFTEMVEKSIVGQEEQFERMRRERELMDLIVKNTEAEIADEILEEETRSLIQDWSERLERQGLTIQDWMEREKKKPEEVEADMRKQAGERAKLRFGVAKLIEERGIALTEDETLQAASDFVASVPEENKAQAQSQMVPGTQAFQEVQWRATVDKLMRQLLD
jgi:trigger factor